MACDDMTADRARQQTAAMSGRWDTRFEVFMLLLRKDPPA
jgi:hypothetical protein